MSAQRSIEVAHAKVANGINLSHNPPARVAMNGDDAIRIRFDYVVHSSHPEQEAWRFKLRAGWDGHEMHEEEHIHEEHRFGGDDFISHIHHDLPMAEGARQLNYEVEAELYKRDASGEAIPYESETVSGQIEIEGGLI